MNRILQVHQLGQSFWLDYIRRDLIDSGALAEMVERGEVRGVTSNPTIFEKAIAGSELYTPALRPLAQAGWSAMQTLDALVIGDIQTATDLFLPLYEETGGADGFVSIEVDPKLADDTQGTVEEARRLWKAVNRPNVMIKIPATSAGIPAIEQATSEGINVNVTLIFALDRYAEVVEAYLRGLERRLERGDSLDHVASVASFFVSRVDTAVDDLLQAVVRAEGPGADRAASLLGKIAIANAKLAYAQFKATFDTPRFVRLSQRGARLQRPLWASTSTKNPDYPDTHYVDNLIGPNTVNTLPPETLEAFRDHGRADLTLEEDLSAARAQLGALETLGISIAEVTGRLEREGVAKFAASFGSLLKTIRGRADELLSELAPLLPGLQARLAELEADRVGSRMWQADGSLWTEDEDEMGWIRDRLGWLNLPHESSDRLATWEAFVDQIRAAGIERVTLLGTGSPSLTADVMRRALFSSEGLEFEVLDSINPAAVREALSRATIGKTLFLVASKSGATTEVLALLEVFAARAREGLGAAAGKAFVAITDPGTPLESIAGERGFLRVFHSPADVGERYAALSILGLLPAIMIGVDARALLRGARRMAHACGPNAVPARNPGLFLGAVLAAATDVGRDKLTIIADVGLEPLAGWIEGLIAESSGKDGKGILPVIGEPPGAAHAYEDDRLLVYLRLDGEHDSRLHDWIRGGVPVAILEVPPGVLGLGESFFQWEMAAAAVCHLLGVNAFNQPNVQQARGRTEALLKAYRKRGTLPEQKALWRSEGISLWAGEATPHPPSPVSLEGLASHVLSQVGDGESLAILAYLPPNPAMERRVNALRRSIRDRIGVATTFGYGPSYLHGTGQLHLGGRGTTVFFLVAADTDDDLEIPEMGPTLGVLERAQALGDFQSLDALGRRVFGLRLESARRFREVIEAFSVKIKTFEIPKG